MGEIDIGFDRAGLQSRRSRPIINWPLAPEGIQRRSDPFMIHTFTE